MIATISSAVATGRRINGRDGLKERHSPACLWAQAFRIPPPSRCPAVYRTCYWPAPPQGKYRSLAPFLHPLRPFLCCACALCCPAARKQTLLDRYVESSTSESASTPGACPPAAARLQIDWEKAPSLYCRRRPAPSPFPSSCRFDCRAREVCPWLFSFGPRDRTPPRSAWPLCAPAVA